jgi:long-chain acyl-CoA synthetase
MVEGGEHPLSLLVARARTRDPIVRQIDECGRLIDSCTWLDVLRRCEHCSAAFAHEFPRGTSVGLTMRQDTDSIVALLACVAAGLRVVCLHPGATQVEVNNCIEHARAVGVVGYASREGKRVSRDPGAIILSSSGTTGGPRMAIREWASLVANGVGASSGLGLQSTDHVLMSVPLCHSYGIDLLCACLISGASLTLLERATPQSLGAGLTSGATVWPSVPFQLEQALRLQVPKHAIRTVVSAGSWLPEAIWKATRAQWGIHVGQLYGATEVGTVSVRLGRESDTSLATGIIGRGVGDASLLVVDRENSARVCAVDEEGELLVRASSMASGYVDGPLLRRGAYWKSGDVAVCRADGEIEITGRWKLLIDVGGFKVNPIEVERVIMTHPSVASCLVVGVRASETIERLRALYVQAQHAPAITEDALRAFVRERLSAAKVPRSFEQVDALPRSATGKLLRGSVQ